MTLKISLNNYSDDEHYDVIVIGGGFYGCAIALFLRTYFKRILILESETDLLLRASLINQARIHNGYHYPRSYLTALRSYTNFPRFIVDFQDCVDSSFEKVYAIARNNSRVNAFQFRKTFSQIGAPINIAPQPLKKLFDPRLIEEVFSVREYAFDAVKLRNTLKNRLAAAQVEILYRTKARKIDAGKNENLVVQLSNGSSLTSTHVFNCTYAGINDLLNNSGLPPLPMKYELAEMALVDVPSPLKNVGITLMDGPFFSLMPFPSRGLHSLSHVRYTPHEAWQYQDQKKPEAYQRPVNEPSQALFMIKDAQRYVPLIREAQPVDAIFEIKTVLLQNEVDDGRPILFRKDYGLKNHSLIMGGKIDNIYDILKRLEESGILPAATSARAS